MLKVGDSVFCPNGAAGTIIARLKAPSAFLVQPYGHNTRPEVLHLPQEKGNRHAIR